jgi:hypothetical protein
MSTLMKIILAIIIYNIFGFVGLMFFGFYLLLFD